jgi:hypothetical protein
VFDCVNHSLLLSKLEYYGIRGAILNWLKSYLSNRKQRVTLNFLNLPSYSSDWKVVKRGVPQGSVLGPLLFNLYLNDFPSIVNEFSNAILFADDASILVSSSDYNELNTILHFQLVLKKIS